MRKRQTFLLTILTPENENASFCGQVKAIASGKTCTFTNIKELYDAIAVEMGEHQHHQPVEQADPAAVRCSEPRTRSS
jgi:hypothetical protein